MANEKRMIDADAFHKELYERPLDFLDIGGDFGYFDETIESVLNEQPTVDAVEVVRCKDCVHYNGEECLNTYGEFEPEPTFFCAYGERRGKDAVD